MDFIVSTSALPSFDLWTSSSPRIPFQASKCADRALGVQPSNARGGLRQAVNPGLDDLPAATATIPPDGRAGSNRARLGLDLQDGRSRAARREHSLVTDRSFGTPRIKVGTLHRSVGSAARTRDAAKDGRPSLQKGSTRWSSPTTHTSSRGMGDIPVMQACHPRQRDHLSRAWPLRGARCETSPDRLTSGRSSSQ